MCRQASNTVPVQRRSVSSRLKSADTSEERPAPGLSQATTGTRRLRRRARGRQSGHPRRRHARTPAAAPRRHARRRSQARSPGRPPPWQLTRTPRNGIPMALASERYAHQIQFSATSVPLFVPSQRLIAVARGARFLQNRAFDHHSATVSPWRWATFHSPPSRRYTCVARRV